MATEIDYADEMGVCRHFDSSKPEDLAEMTRSGMIWSVNPQRGANAILDGTIPLAECENMPADVRAIITRRMAK